jgi:acyl-coenzyme A synthetase/AMP-(fatty) acid ligase
MYLRVYNDDGTVNNTKIDKENFLDKSIEGKVSYIASTSKEMNAINIFKSYFNGAKSILLDDTNKVLMKKIDELQIPCFDEDKSNNTIFNDKEFSFIYFTSGSTGEATAALKSKSNIEKEIEALSNLVKKYDIKRVIVTVPFIHIYGSLTGAFFPYLNGIDIILKEHFLPNDLLDMCEDNSLVVATPLYIKALNKISSKKDLSKVLFVSSTAPLQADDAKEFNQKFNADILQLFGSTETGGISYKFNDEVLWTPLENVVIETNTENELKVISPYVSDELYTNGFKKISGEIQTFDYIEKEDDGRFKLVGRSSQILKIAGKRYSTISIENILENIDGIEKALVYVKNDKDSLRGEILDITLETKEEFCAKEIKKILQSNLSNLKFSMDLKCVDKIPTSSVGKKLRI